MSKHNELNRCITSRKRKLQELYHATVSFSGGITHNNGETIFLETNNILEGRFFDASTLPPVLPSTFASRTGPTAQQSSHTHQNLASGEESKARLQFGGENSTGPNGTSGLQEKSTTTANAFATSTANPWSSNGIAPLSTSANTSSTGVQADLSLAQPQPSVIYDSTKSHETKQPPQNPTYVALPKVLTGSFEVKSQAASPYEDTSIAPSKVLPFSSDDAISLSFSGVKPVEPEQHLSPAHTIRLPPKEAQERQLEKLDHEQSGGSQQQSKALGEESEKTSRDTIQRQASPEERSTHKITIAENQSKHAANRDVSSSLSDSSHVEASSIQDAGYSSDRESGKQHKDLLRQAFQVASESVFAGVPSTPDEQLRLEEAQSVHLSKSSSSFSKDRPYDGINAPAVEVLASAPPQFARNAKDAENEVVGDLISKDALDSRQAEKLLDEVGDNDVHNMESARVIQDRRLPGMTGDLSKDLTLSQRPPMHIDNGSAAATDSVEPNLGRKSITQSAATPLTLVSSSISTKLGPPIGHTQSPPERMTTRVSSGALRHKSVSEILGETPKSTTYQADRNPLGRDISEIHRDNLPLQSPKSVSSAAATDSMAFKLRLNELKEKEKDRSKLSTVVFARQQPSNESRYSESEHVRRPDLCDFKSEERDYLLPLFAMQAVSPPQSQGLNALLASAHKTLTTSNHYTDFHEQQDCRVLKRIYALQNSNRWSLRQIERSIEPTRPTTHWDVLMSHMKWMRTDFREERKWKITAAKSMADWCAEWVASPREGRSSLQIKTRNSSAKGSSKSTSEATPDLVPSTEDDSSDAMDEDSPHMTVSHVSAPAAIFSFAPEDVFFSLNKTPATEKLLSELPLYQPSTEVQDAMVRCTNQSPDVAWRTPIIPLSRFALGKMVTREQGPVRKRSRYAYDEVDEIEQSSLHQQYRTLEQCLDAEPPEQNNVALFNPENKHIRDRIHAGHAFRPPSEFNMPSQSFFESRQSSQWTWYEEDELRRLVREYAYNWSLISSCLSSPSIFSSGAERRTPWECFERWVDLENLPTEMNNTQYFKTYHSRMQAAQNTLKAQLAQQHHGNNIPPMLNRRILAVPVRVDRRKNNKYLAIVDAMRKLAKKRETAIQKQQHVAGLAALRKANEAVQPRPPMHTPRDFSRLKYERECKRQEIAEAYRQQILQQQKAAMQQKANQQAGQQQAGSSTMQATRNATPGATNSNSPVVGSSLPTSQIPLGYPNQMRPVPSLPKLANVPSLGNGAPSSNAQMGTNLVPQAPMQPQMQGPQRIPPQMGSDSMRVYQEAARVQQDQQRFLQQQRQQQQHTQPNGLSGTSGSPNMPNLNLLPHGNSGVLANVQATNGLGSPSTNGVLGPVGSTSPPRMPHSSQPQPLSSGMVPAVNHISTEMKARHPQASPEQITKMTTEHLTNQYRVSRAAQAAMQAAAGGNAIAVANNNLQAPQQQAMNGVNHTSPLTNPQVYAQMLRSQQSSQQNRSAGNGLNGGRTGSGSATPQANRSGSTQGGLSQSPRPSQVQMAGGQ